MAARLGRFVVENSLLVDCAVCGCTLFVTLQTGINRHVSVSFAALAFRIFFVA